MVYTTDLGYLRWFLGCTPEFVHPVLIPMFIQDPSVQCHVMFFSNIKSEFMAIFAPLRCPGEHCTKNMRQDQDSHRRLKIPSFCVGDSMESPKTHNNFWLVVLTCFNPLEKMSSSMGRNIPYMKWKNKKFMFQTTNQLVTI